MQLLRPNVPSAALAVFASAAQLFSSTGSASAQEPVAFVISAEPENLVSGSLKLLVGQAQVPVWATVVSGTNQASLAQSTMTWTSSDTTVVRLTQISNTGRHVAGLRDGTATISSTAKSWAWGPVVATLQVIVGTGQSAAGVATRAEARPGVIMERAPRAPASNNPVVATRPGVTVISRLSPDVTIHDSLRNQYGAAQERRVCVRWNGKPDPRNTNCIIWNTTYTVSAPAVQRSITCPASTQRIQSHKSDSLTANLSADQRVLALELAARSRSAQGAAPSTAPDVFPFEVVCGNR